MKTKIYLDTSVPSAYFDFNKPVRQLMTQKWFENDIKNFNVYISTLVLEEIENNKNEQLKLNMLNLLDSVSASLLDITDEIIDIAKLYRKKILTKEINDTIHIAASTFYNIGAIVSWNFRHIVNFKTIHSIHEINKKNNYNLVEIISIVNLGGDKYGSL